MDDLIANTPRPSNGLWHVLDSISMKQLVPAIIIPIVVFLLFLFVPGLKDRPWTAVRIAGAILTVIGYVFMLTARMELGESFSVHPKATGLVTHGLYARIRNPMYVFVDVMFLGLILALEMYWILAILAVFAFVQIRQARREGTLLQEKFGQAYTDYRRKTWF